MIATTAILFGIAIGAFAATLIYCACLYWLARSSYKERKKSLDQLDELNRLRAESNCYQKNIAEALTVIAKIVKGDR